MNPPGIINDFAARDKGMSELITIHTMLDAIDAYLLGNTDVFFRTTTTVELDNRSQVIMVTLRQWEPLPDKGCNDKTKK